MIEVYNKTCQNCLFSKNRIVSKEHQIEMQITLIFIQNKLSLSSQSKILKSIQKKIDFCKETARKVNQHKLNL
jgi:hypothetical protein